MASTILAPIDFSPHSLQAARTALRLAALTSSQVEIIYAYVDPVAKMQMPYSDELALAQQDIDQVVDGQQIRADADRRMAQAADTLREEIASGSLPPVRFTTNVLDGFPEETILDYARQTKPLLIVMGTRGSGQKAADMIGSVTAEILDATTVPVLSIPEQSQPFYNRMPQHIAVLAESGKGDFPSLKFLNQLLPKPAFQVTLVNLLTRHPSFPDRTSTLKKFQEAYPNYQFKLMSLSFKGLLTGFGQIQAHEGFDLLLLPSQRKNIFARLFNPGAAHRLLFHVDLPMLVFPIHNS